MKFSNCKCCGASFELNRRDKVFCKLTCKEWFRKRGPYIQHKRDKCDFCGFVPIHSYQLDVDHTDVDHSNNEPDNLQTLCANCNRLKTHLNQDYKG